MATSTQINPTKIQITAACAAKILDWLLTRGGVLRWESAELGACWEPHYTPALTEDGKPHASPGWRFTEKPKEHILTADRFEVTIDKPVKQFKVGVRMNWQTGASHLTDAATKRVEAEVAKAGVGAYRVFDHTEEKNCTVFAPVLVVPLSEYDPRVHRNEN